MTLRKTFAFGAAGAILFVAGPIAAAGGTLEPFPDILADFVNGDGTLWQTPWKSRWLQVIAMLAVLVPIANKLVFAPLLATLDERDARMAGATDKASEIEQRADAVFDRYQTAVTKARNEADDIRREKLEEARKGQTEITASARGDAEASLARVRAEVAASRDGARTELAAGNAQLARTVAEQVLGRSL